MKKSFRRSRMGSASEVFSAIYRTARSAVTACCTPSSIATFVVLAIGVAATFSSPAAAEPTGLAGTWDTDWGELVIDTHKDGYRGHYIPSSNVEINTGDMTLVPNGNALVGYWAESDAAEKCKFKRMGTHYWGRLLVDQPIKTDGFAIKWGYCAYGTLDNLWHVNRKTAGPANSSSSGAAAPVAPKTPGLAQPLHVSAPTIRPTQKTFAPDKGVEVRFSGLPAEGQDWLAISSVNDGPKRYYDLIMLTGKPTEGTHRFKPLPAGDYEVRLYTNWPDGGYDIVARSSVTVGEKPAAALPQTPLAIPAPAAVLPVAPITPTAGKTQVVDGKVDTPIWDSETGPGQPSGAPYSAAVQKAIDEFLAQQQPKPQPSASGGPGLDAILAKYTRLYVTLGGEHWFYEGAREYPRRDKNIPDYVYVDDSVESSQTVHYTGYFNFSTDLAAGYFSNHIASTDAGVNTAQDLGFGCPLQTGELTWNGTIFSYSLSKEKLEALDERNDTSRKVYCGIEIVGVVASDRSALKSLDIYFNSSLAFRRLDAQYPTDWSGARNAGITIRLQNLPIDLAETYSSESPEYQTLEYLDYSGCMEFFGAGESASSFVANLGAYDPSWSTFRDPPHLVDRRSYRVYSHTRWTGEIKPVAGRGKELDQPVTPGIRVELCR